ncbi:MAG: NEAT domain-containing protein, partial [Sarcina sp.]
LVSFRIVPKNIDKDIDKNENKEKESIESSTIVPVEDNLSIANPNETINIVTEALNSTNSHSNTNKDMIKEVKIKTLKENEDIPSMAGKYLEKASYENKDGHKYMRVVLNRSDWMNNVKAVVDGQQVQPEILNVIKNESGEAKTEFRFPIKDENSKIKLKMNVKPMNNALVTFRILPVKEEITEVNDKLLKKEPTEQVSVLNSEKENINTIEDFNNKQEDNVIKENNIYEKDILPRTGLPIGASLGYLGALISTIGIIIKKKK